MAKNKTKKAPRFDPNQPWNPGAWTFNQAQQLASQILGASEQAGANLIDRNAANRAANLQAIYGYLGRSLTDTSALQRASQPAVAGSFDQGYKDAQAAMNMGGSNPYTSALLTSMNATAQGNAVQGGQTAGADQTLARLYPAYALGLARQDIGASEAQARKDYQDLADKTTQQRSELLNSIWQNELQKYGARESARQLDFQMTDAEKNRQQNQEQFDQTMVENQRQFDLTYQQRAEEAKARAEAEGDQAMADAIDRREDAFKDYSKQAFDIATQLFNGEKEVPFATRGERKRVQRLSEDGLPLYMGPDGPTPEEFHKDSRLNKIPNPPIYDTIEEPPKMSTITVANPADAAAVYQQLKQFLSAALAPYKITPTRLYNMIYAAMTQAGYTDLPKPQEKKGTYQPSPGLAPGGVKPPSKRVRNKGKKK